MPRRSTQQIAQDLRNRAAALERKAQIASSPELRAAIKFRAMLPVIGRTSDEAGLILALDAYIGDERAS